MANRGFAATLRENPNEPGTRTKTAVSGLLAGPLLLDGKPCAPAVVSIVGLDLQVIPLVPGHVADLPSAPPPNPARFKMTLKIPGRSAPTSSGLASALGCQPHPRQDHPAAPSRAPYANINVLMLWGAAVEAGYVSPFWMTFKQALELNAHVRKGEKGSLVVYANKITRTEQTESGEVEREIPFLKGYTVFNVEQIDGLPAHHYAQPLPRFDPISRHRSR